MKKLSFKTLILASIFLTGCTISFGGSNTPSVSGVFKSFDRGNTWITKSLFLHSGGTGTISGVNVINLTFDPQDNRAIYLATETDGLLFTYDGGDSWQKAKQVGNGRIEAVAIDAKNKCVIYATFTNTVLKSVDCSRTWAEIYIDTRADKNVTALAVDFFNSLIVYAGNSAGDILKSTNGGTTWQVIHRLNNPITKILINPNDTRVLYLATNNNGIFKSTNSGISWIDINDGLKQYSGSMEYRNLIFDASQSDGLMLVAKYGLIKSNNGGATWNALNLITPPATADIFSVAINPQNNKEIYYATASTFYKTTDGGQNWITKRLPSNAVATYMQVDSNDPNILYMGFSNLGR
ncbi:MAG: hypothetical protein CMI53_00345 [Parcubacteria group bacterium]|nr:hypothetical protein [Parcubacteria group bacterium]